MKKNAVVAIIPENRKYNVRRNQSDLVLKINAMQTKIAWNR